MTWPGRRANQAEFCDSFLSGETEEGGGKDKRKQYQAVGSALNLDLLSNFLLLAYPGCVPFLWEGWGPTPSTLLPTSQLSAPHTCELPLPWHSVEKRGFLIKRQCTQRTVPPPPCSAALPHLLPTESLQLTVN